MGIDYATDGVPLQKIYDSGLNIEPPPNSPWAAINDNFGLEIMGHMTRIANLPGDRFMFRFYVHDPWWINSPWYDRYDSNPHDIYLPMSIARIDSDGNVQSADNLNILSIDNSFGNMPDCCVNEPIPHLIKADKDKSDEPSPFVWVYPVREYTESKTESELREMYIGDRFVEKSINDGFPLNCVVSTDNFLGHDKNVYMKSVLVSPVPKCSRVLEKFIEFAEGGIKIIFYGTKESLAELSKNAGFISVDTESGVLLREAAAKTDYVIIHNRADSTSKVPALTVNKSNNGYWFSVYNPDNTTESLLKFPQGAPILLGGSTEIKDGFASYHFSMSEHRECRIFVKQRDGVVKARERVSINIRNKRRIGIFGLRDAEIIYYPEKNTVCDATAAAGPFDPEDNFTPVYSDKFKLVNDPEYGKYYKAEHISGDFAFYVTREKTK